MALYKVDSDTADLTKVAGGTLYADLPIGSWIKNDMATIPSGFLKVGDTISQSECPELYAKYGSTVPYKADTSELSEYETFTITTSNKEVNYDGILIVNFNPSSSQLFNGTVSVNNVVIGNVSSSGGQQQAVTVEIKKGDNVKYAGSNTGTVTGKIAYYKKSLIIKAKHTPVPADFMNAVDDAISDTTVDTVANGNMHPVTSNAVYDKLNTKQDVIKTITVHAENWRNYTTFENRYTDWVQGEITSPTIPSGYIALRYFAEVSEVQNGHVDCYPTSTSSNGIPNCIGVNTDGQVTTCKLRLGAICIKL